MGAVMRFRMQWFANVDLNYSDGTVAGLNKVLQWRLIALPMSNDFNYLQKCHYTKLLQMRYRYQP